MSTAIAPAPGDPNDKIRPAATIGPAAEPGIDPSVLDRMRYRLDGIEDKQDHHTVLLRQILKNQEKIMRGEGCV